MVAENPFSAKIKRAEQVLKHLPALSTTLALQEQSIMAERDSICASEEKPVEYRDIQGYPGYRIGSDGTVWSCWHKSKGCKGVQTTEWWQMRPYQQNESRYVTIGLTVNGKQKTIMVHELVLNAFVGPRPSPKMQARHFPSGDKRNNSISNLCWGTAIENNRDKEIQGTKQIGERAVNRKLTTENVREILRRSSNGESRRSLARRFGVTKQNIMSIVQRKTWGHVEIWEEALTPAAIGGGE